MKLNIGDRYFCFRTVRDGTGAWEAGKEQGNIDIPSGTIIIVENSTDTPNEFHYPHLFKVPNTEYKSAQSIGFNDEEIKKYLFKIFD